jgi:beta-glucosidase-like glycosyl hydrolase
MSVSDATAQEFETVHLPPFVAAISAGVEGVMMAHIVAAAYDPDKPASLSDAVTTDLLRGSLGFQGLVVTDDLSMDAVLRTEEGADREIPAPRRDKGGMAQRPVY